MKLSLTLVKLRSEGGALKHSAADTLAVAQGSATIIRGKVKAERRAEVLAAPFTLVLRRPLGEATGAIVLRAMKDTSVLKGTSYTHELKKSAMRCCAVKRAL